MSQTLLRQIQEAAMAGSASDLPKLLRMCKVLASRLRSDALKKLADAELKGYSESDVLPSYRVIPVDCELIVQDSIHTNQTHIIPESTIEKALGKEAVHDHRTAHIRQNVAELTALAASSGGVLSIVWSQDEAFRVAPLVSKDKPIRAQGTLTKQALIGILDAIQTAVLDIVLELEETDPTLGEGDPSHISKPVAKKVEQIVETHYHVTGDNTIINAGIAQTQNNVEIGNLDSLKTALHQLGMAPEEVEQTALVVQKEATPSGVLARLKDLGGRLALKAAESGVAQAIQRFFPT